MSAIRITLLIISFVLSVIGTIIDRPWATKYIKRAPTSLLLFVSLLFKALYYYLLVSDDSVSTENRIRLIFYTFSYILIYVLVPITLHLDLFTSFSIAVPAILAYIINL